MMILFLDVLIYQIRTYNYGKWTWKFHKLIYLLEFSDSVGRRPAIKECMSS